MRGTALQGSDGYGVRAGVRFENPRLLEGEMAVGYALRDNRDAAQADLRGMIVDGTIVWHPTALTNVTFNARTAFDETALTGVSSVYRRDVGVQVDHSFRRYLIGSARISYGYDSYEGTSRVDERFQIAGGLTYRLNRNASVKGELRHERLISQGGAAGAASPDYTANIIFVGLRFQR
jgi:hypothetical protein